MTDFLKRFAPDFCFLTVRDLFRMMEVYFPSCYIEYGVFHATFTRMLRNGYFESKPSPYHTIKSAGFEPALYRRIK